LYGSPRGQRGLVDGLSRHEKRTTTDVSDRDVVETERGDDKLNARDLRQRQHRHCLRSTRTLPNERKPRMRVAGERPASAEYTRFAGESRGKGGDFTRAPRLISAPRDDERQCLGCGTRPAEVQVVFLDCARIVHRPAGRVWGRIVTLLHEVRPWPRHGPLPSFPTGCKSGAVRPASRIPAGGS
jgi:hypothetical protein